eukprot:COSAG05_NODE_2686_length_2770_cov_1.786971_3_plen_55_part_00
MCGWEKLTDRWEPSRTNRLRLRTEPMSSVKSNQIPSQLEQLFATKAVTDETVSG